jgi:hypothetical protein
MPGDTIALTPEQERAGRAVDALDLEPIVYKLMHPGSGGTAMTLAEADELIAAYRCFLKLCAWCPDEPVVPSRAIDEAWHTHILDTAKYAEDCNTVFGFFLHHFPYLGMRGPEDEADLHAAYDRTCSLFLEHFGTDPRSAGGGRGDCEHCFGNTGGSGGKCTVPPPPGSADLANVSVCSECSSDAKCGKCISCDRTARNAERPRPDRGTPVPA